MTLTTYDTLLRSTDELGAPTWEVAVFDEAQRIKNPRTKAARATRRVQAASLSYRAPSQMRVTVAGWMLPCGLAGTPRCRSWVWEANSHNPLACICRACAQVIRLRRGIGVPP